MAGWIRRERPLNNNYLLTIRPEGCPSGLAYSKDFFWLTERFKKGIEAVELDLLDRLQPSPQLPVRKTQAGEPDQVAFRQVDEPAPQVLAERHACLCQVNKLFAPGVDIAAHDGSICASRSQKAARLLALFSLPIGRINSG